MPSPLRIFVLADTHNHLPANIETLAEGGPMKSGTWGMCARRAFWKRWSESARR